MARLSSGRLVYIAELSLPRGEGFKLIPSVNPTVFPAAGTPPEKHPLRPLASFPYKGERN